MKIDTQGLPRDFEVGSASKIVMRDCAHLDLAADEQVTFTTQAGSEYDVARKNWGFYATPSVNGRLQRFGLKAVLVANADGNYYVMLVERGSETEFEKYAADEKMVVCGPLDDSTLPVIAEALRQYLNTNNKGG